MSQVLQALAQRRSQYALTPNLPLPEAEVEALIKQAVRLSPSSFNSQSSRAVILFGKASHQFWDIALDALRPLVPAEAFPTTEGKIKSFAAGAGTVLFYEEEKTVESLQAQFPLYADNFPVWSEHSSAIAQIAVWTVLAEAGIGASLQHYNPLVDAETARVFGIPARAC